MLGKQNMETLVSVTAQSVISPNADVDPVI
jgi:hypothetical protein